MNYLVTEKKHTPAALIKDVNFTYMLLTNGHPGVYWYITKEQLAFKFDSLKKTITTPLTSKEFYKKMAPLVAEVRCGHTRMILVTKKLTKKEKDSVAKLGKPINQFGYKVINNKLYVNFLNRKITQAKKGDEILAIDGISSLEIIKNLEKNYASDGYNETFKTAVLNRAFANWYATIYDNKDTLAFKIKNSNTIINLNLTTIKKEDKKDSTKVKNPIKKLNKDSVLAKKNLAKEKRKLRYKGNDEFKKPMLDLKFMEKDSSIAYLKVKSFSFPYANFDRFFKESFETLKKGNTKNLILDLRDNGGGSLTACRNLFAYLVDKDFVYLTQTEVDKRFNPYLHTKGILNALKVVPFQIANTILLMKKKDKYKLNYKGMKPLHPKNNHFDGKLYVLINGYSFSASALIASNLQQIKRATFVGQETGGGYNGCVAGSIPILSMPNSKLKLRMGLYPIMPNAHTETVGRGIFPDQEIIPTIEDVISGKDRELEWVMNSIKL
ncbi:S41 family peptidase [Pedobacter sp. Du54]|uniref:S41 family peptidase n=1 Tax=Pedobacter anseongensis TaxID=3133439 RepID=UPI0030A09357